MLNEKAMKKVANGNMKHYEYFFQELYNLAEDSDAGTVQTIFTFVEDKDAEVGEYVPEIALRVRLIEEE